jgi:hypothetical protein
MTKRLYKNEEEKDKHMILDDRHELLNLYVSKCCRCKHFKEWDYFCAAFPGGIPDEYLSGEKMHDNPVDGQVGDIAFEEID